MTTKQCEVIFFVAFWVSVGAEANLQSQPALQEELTNDAVIQLVKAGLDDELIMMKISQSKTNFSLSTEGLIRLKQEGVSSDVVKCMMSPVDCNSDSSTPGARIEEAARVEAADDEPGSGLVSEIGVYYKKEGSWIEVLPEVVNWKTGGTLKNVFSAGVVKKDINGNINGVNSRNSVRTPLEFLVYAPEGTAITEYQLLRLRTNNDYREFRTVTGGVFNQRGGALRDIVPFEGQRIASRTYLVILPNNLGAGEYGFLPPSAMMSAGASSSLGKMYTFRLLE